jgi:hypothetical protein
LWNSTDNILGKLDMTDMDELNQEVPRKLRISEVEKDRDQRKQVIEIMNEINPGVLDNYLIKPVQMTTLVENYTKGLQKGPQERSNKKNPSWRDSYGKCTAWTKSKTYPESSLMDFL